MDRRVGRWLVGQFFNQQHGVRACTAQHRGHDQLAAAFFSTMIITVMQQVATASPQVHASSVPVLSLLGT